MLQQRCYRCFAPWTIFVVAMVVGGKWLYDLNYQLTAEYNTASVIRRVTEFVSSNGGCWPLGWEEIAEVDYARRYTRIDFDVSAEQLVRDRERIYQTIVPMTGMYHTYPHAKRDLDRLWDVLAESYSESHDQVGQGDPPKKSEP